MGQSLAPLYIHLIFGTKYRKPFITKSAKPKLHSYLAGTLKNYDSPSIIINSMPDHVHVLFRMSKNYTLAKIVEEVKKQSSKWIKEIEGINNDFSWQTGYAAFPVCISKFETVKQYISNQEEHHKKKTYKEEVEEFLKAYDVTEYNEDYFWR